MSAAKLNRFWPFLLALYDEYGKFSTKKLPNWAEAVGMVRGEFEALMKDPAQRELLVASKQEGLRNRVKATPTVFINGRKYVYEMSIEAIQDVLEEIYKAGHGGG